MHGFTRAPGLALAALLVMAIAPSSPAGARERSAAGECDALVIERVSVLPMTAAGEDVLHDATVLIRGERIESIAPASGATRPSNACRVSGAGKWLMPALTDMHAHQASARGLQLLTGNSGLTASMFDNEDLLLPFVANGVLQIFNPAAMAEQVGLRDEIDAGRVLAPHIELAALVDGSARPIWPLGFAHTAGTSEEGRQVVRDMKADGFRFIKTYTGLDLGTFTSIIDEAKKLGVRVVGHIPGRRQETLEHWLQPGFEMVTHSEEYAYQADDIAAAEASIPRYVEMARRTGTLLTSTLTLNERIVEQMRQPGSLAARPEMRYVHPVMRSWWTGPRSPYANAPPERIARLTEVVEFNRKLVKAFADAGITVFPGTDAFVPGVVAGFSLHDELVSLAAAGLTPRQILPAATRKAAEFLGVANDRGTIEPGKRADLLLLDANPLADVANTRRIAAVIVGGRHLPRARLDAMLEDLAKRYASIDDGGRAVEPPRRSQADHGHH